MIVQPLTAKAKPEKDDIVDFDRLCRILKVDSLETMWDWWMSCDLSEEEEGEAVEVYTASVLTVAERLFAEHKLTLVELKGKYRGWSWRIRPETTWRDAAAELVTTINGVGMFEFRDVREFCRSGPYTPKEAVLNHVGWIKWHPEVYGDGSAKSMVENEMRRRR